MQFGVLSRSNGPLSQKLPYRQCDDFIVRQMRSQASRRVRLSESGTRHCYQTKAARLAWLLRKPPVLTPPESGREIMAAIAACHGLTPFDIQSGCRSSGLVRIRHEITYAIATRTSLSLAQIGKLMGRDHTSVLYALRSHARRNSLPMPRGLKPEKGYAPVIHREGEVQ